MKKIFSYILVFFIFLFLFSINVKAYEVPYVSSQSILFKNLDTDEVIYEKNSEEKRPLASITKVMTALVSIENIKDFNEKVVVTWDMIKDIDFDYTTAGFKTGNVVTYDELLYGVMLPSGADATNILGISIGGSIENFVNMMNEKAKEIGMNNTHFTNTIGMDDENHYSTASDIALMMKYAYQNKIFMKYASTEEYMVTSIDKLLKGPVKKMHQDYNMNYIIGGKTGFTEIAGECLATISENNKSKFILVTLGADYANKYQHMEDQKTIYEYFFNNYDYKKILNKGDTLVKLKTIYDVSYTIKSDEEVIRYIDKMVTNDNLTYEYSGIKILGKNIKKGDKLGTYFIKLKDDVLYQKNIYAPEDVKMTFEYFIKDNIVFYSVSLALIIILFIIFVHKKRKSRKNKHR